jgi:hypothetical protein
MNIDQFLDRQYDSKNYNCVHFVCEVFTKLFNEDYYKILGGFLFAPGHRCTCKIDLRPIQQVARPERPCLALFQVAKNNPHVGIWMDGKILHLRESGVSLMPLEIVMLSFKKVRFYNVKG